MSHDTSSSAQPEKTGMSRAEVRASVSLASIFSLRMLGLFLVLPVFAVHAHSLPGGDSDTLVGIALGIYGLAQACGQIPYGIASDRYGRKRIIVIGLLLFALGSFVAAGAQSVMWLLVGRALQGSGAISAAITAFIADSTREEHRTKAMAMVGASIGVTFAVSMVASPLLYRAIGMGGIFGLTGVLSLLAIAVVVWAVPAAPMVQARRVSLREVLRQTELLRLNWGVFTLHLTQVAMFLVVPAALVQTAGLPLGEHWKIYLPVVLASFVLMLPPIIVAEKYGRMKPVFVGAISLMLLVQVGFWLVLSRPLGSVWMLVTLLFLFFVAFNILEAAQPSLVSRIAPPAAKGAALGVYNTLQALGLSCGGALGGWLQQHVGNSAVFLLSAVLTLTWLIIAANMKNLPRRSAPAAGATA